MSLEELVDESGATRRGIQSVVSEWLASRKMSVMRFMVDVELFDTLEERLPGLEGRLFAKTGTISNVNALSGYLTRNDGTELTFSILTNGSGLPASTVRAAIDALVRTLAEG